MKVRMSFRPFVNYIVYLTTSRGYYTVNFATRKVKFTYGKAPKDFTKHLSKTRFVDFKKAFKQGDAQIIHLCEMEFRNHGNIYTLDFIKGYLTPSACNAEEVLMSTEPPYETRFYDRNEVHDTFSLNTLRLRRITLD